MLYQMLIFYKKYIKNNFQYFIHAHVIFLLECLKQFHLVYLLHMLINGDVKDILLRDYAGSNRYDSHITYLYDQKVL
jgi:hypothetical protein